MRPLAAGAALILFLSAGGASAAAGRPCPAQRMPPAIESAGELPPRSHVVAFAATPWEFPRRAWVVRVSRRGDVEATIEIVRLLGQARCNRWDVEKRWSAPIARRDYEAVAEAVERFGLPAAGLVANGGGGGDLATDGTGLELRLEAPGWRVARTLTQHGRDGAGLSAIFRDLVSRHVPAQDRPVADWRTRR
ncbi:MAG TPA: hypothetical protein VFQ67_16845 [Allosphingosinicella sp.]|nr:hypothetical protein [Allosphingosinicella sp.]